MASKKHGELTNQQIVRLGVEISTQAMESFAKGYLDISDARVKSLKEEHKHNTDAFNRDLITIWAYRNSDENQVEVSVTKNIDIIFRLENTNWNWRWNT